MSAVGGGYWDHPSALVCLGVAVHLVLAYSVIDIHFQTPVVPGIAPLPVNISAPAKRVVLIVADGLRADKLFSSDASGAPLAPFLRSRGLEHGAFGVAHTRPPTESRPGHVAIAAGFYEDPSALLSGWKVNPVKFDSIFNHTLGSWGLGAPDVVPIFEGHGPYAYDAYPPDFEDFSADDLTTLDAWVFDRAFGLIQNATATNESHPLKDGPSVLFLHLLGLDSNGHAHGGPSSPEYLHNIKFVDQGIRNLAGWVEAAFPDGCTSFVFTADHGMTAQASHGDGSPENTETPLVLWGPGIRGRLASQNVSEWGYNSKSRVDIEQAQIAPLMAALLGVSTPVNALFHVPVELLGVGDLFRSQAAWASARQVVAAYERKAEQVEETVVGWKFRPYGPLQNGKDVLMSRIEKALHCQRYPEAERLSTELADLAEDGLLYLQRYDGPVLKVAVSLSFLGWMAFLALQLLVCVGNQHHASIINTWRVVGSVLILLSWLRLALAGAQFTYYLYAVLPLACWAEVLHIIQQSTKVLKSRALDAPVATVGVGVPAVLLFLFGISSGFNNRRIFLFLMCVAGVQAMLLRPRSGMQGFLCFSSFAVCGAFTWLPLTKSSNPVMSSGGGLMGIVAVLSTRPWRQDMGNWRLAILLAQILTVLAASCLVWISHLTPSQLRSRSGALMGWTPMQALSWLIFTGSPLIPLLSGCAFQERIQSVFLGFLSSITVVSISWEPLFFCSLWWVLWSWQEMGSADVMHIRAPSVKSGGRSHFTGSGPGPGYSHKGECQEGCGRYNQVGGDSAAYASHQQQLPHGVGLADVVDALTFLLLINVAFFGQGNAASVASFDIASVYRLTTVFNPFIMGGVLVAKILIPLVLVTCAFTAKVQRAGMWQFRMYLLVVLLSNVIALRFFFLVRNTGSWAEIGTSLGFYGIMNAQVVIVLVLIGVSQIYMGGISSQSKGKND
ncbi:unnamed protein product [Ostreobium quekettii]|uniref:GPI ethanolamine phosphate transferase 1 n=1 Tax=Ostreobium quekettii TaxID=121088 RepID=A0A8S1ITT2_9CHLO|nr:unnamed protein product [Ostreobium quekettii]